MKRLALISLLALAGCTVGPNYSGPPKLASDAATRGTFVRAQDRTLNTAPGVARWWETLNDPVLNTLVEDALAKSPTIDIAQARIREASAQLRSQRAAQLPSVSVSGAYLHANLPGIDLSSDDSSGDSGDSSSTSADFFNLGGTASWEPDLFGGGRRSVEQARANVERRFADLSDAQVSLSAQVAQAYVNLRDVQIRSRLNDESLKLQTQALDLTRQRFHAGTATQIEVDRAGSQLQSTEAQTLPLKAEIEQYLNQLATLTGREPGALDTTLATPADIPLPPAQVPIGDPATLIAHRPDVRSAERALAAATAGIGVDKAKLYPSLSFTGLFGLGGPHPGDVFGTSNLAAIFAPMLSWSILDFGRTQAAVHGAEAQRDEAEGQYRKAVLAALEDAETSLSRFGNARQQLGRLISAQEGAARATELNKQRYAAGTTTLIDQLNAERQRLSTESAVVEGKARLTDSYIAVHKALGLGWTEAPSAPVVTPGDPGKN